jgi:hypothetical protein
MVGGAGGVIAERVVRMVYDGATRLNLAVPGWLYMAGPLIPSLPSFPILFISIIVLSRCNSIIVILANTHWDMRLLIAYISAIARFHHRVITSV